MRIYDNRYALDRKEFAVLFDPEANPMVRAEALEAAINRLRISRLPGRKRGLTIIGLCRHYGWSPRTIRSLLALLDLPTELRDRIRSGACSVREARKALGPAPRRVRGRPMGAADPNSVPPLTAAEADMKQWVETGQIHAYASKDGTVRIIDLRDESLVIDLPPKEAALRLLGLSLPVVPARGQHPTWVPRPDYRPPTT